MAGHSLRRSYALTAGDAVRSLVVVRPLKFPGPLFSIVVAFLLAMTASAGAGRITTSSVAPSANSVTFKVPKGTDQLAPDITSIAVSNNDPGVITFRINVANRPQLGQDMLFDVKMALPKLVVQKVATTPQKPAAGKPFSVRLTAARSDTGARLKGGQITCAARAGDKSISSQTPRFVGTQAMCTWIIPGFARGKKFVGSIAIVFEGKRVSRNVSLGIG